MNSLVPADLQLGHHLLERAALTGNGKALAPLAQAVIGDLAGAGLVLHHGELVAGLRRGIEAQHLDRHRGAGFLDLLAEVVDQRAHPAIGRACHDEIAKTKRAALDESRADGTAAALELGFDDDALGGTIGIGGKFQHLGL